MPPPPASDAVSSAAGSHHAAAASTVAAPATTNSGDESGRTSSALLRSLLPDFLSGTLEEEDAEPREIEARLQQLDACLNTVMWSTPTATSNSDAAGEATHQTSDGANTRPADYAVDAQVFARASSKKAAGAPVMKRSSSVVVGSAHAASAVAGAASSAATLPLSTQAQRDREESSIAASVRSGDVQRLRSVLLEVHTLRESQLRLTLEKASLSQSLSRMAGQCAIEKEVRQRLQLQLGLPVETPRAPKRTGERLFLADTTTASGTPETPQRNLASTALGASASSPSLLDGGGSPKPSGLALLKAKARAKAEAAATIQQEQEQQVAEDEKVAPARLDAQRGDDPTILSLSPMIAHRRRERQRSRRISGSDSLSPAPALASLRVSIDSTGSPAIGSSSPQQKRRKKKRREVELDGPPYRSRFDSPHGDAPPHDEDATDDDYTRDAGEEELSPHWRERTGMSGSSTTTTPSKVSSPAAAAHTRSLRQKQRRADEHTRNRGASDPSSPTMVAAEADSPVPLTSPLLQSTHSSLPQLPHHLRRKQTQTHFVDPMVHTRSPTRAPVALSLASHGIAMPSRSLESTTGGGVAERHFSPSRLAPQMMSMPNTIQATAQLQAQQARSMQPSAYGGKRITTG